jgi:hypothetical protein
MVSQQDVLDFIRAKGKTFAYEIQRELDLSNYNQALDKLLRLENKGLIERCDPPEGYQQTTRMPVFYRIKR